jgi:hypothetical protein
MAAKISKKTTKPQQKPGKRPGRKLSDTTRFVLSMPRDTAAVEVVKAAAAQKIELTAALVHKIRSRYKGPPPGPQVQPKLPATPPRTEPAAPGGKQYPSASAFVREQPLNRPVNEVVVEGTKLGLNVKPLLVRVVRSKMRHAGDAKPAAAEKGAVRRGRPPRAAAQAVVKRGRPPAAAARVASSASGAAEAQLRSLVVQLGTARAKALVTELERAIEALISGR